MMAKRYNLLPWILPLVLLVVQCKKDDGDECPACPKITSISPSHGPYGAEVTLSGSNFSSTLTNNLVRFNGTTVPSSDMVSGSTTKLVVKVPKGCGTGPVTVYLDADLYSDPGPVFTYDLTELISVFAGQPGVAANPAGPVPLGQAQFDTPREIVVDKAGIVIVLDKMNDKVKKYDPSTGMFKTVNVFGTPDLIFLDDLDNLYIGSNNGSQCTVYKCVSGSFNAVNFKFLDIQNYGVSVNYAVIDDQSNIYAAVTNQFGEISTIVKYPQFSGESVLLSLPLVAGMQIKDTLIYAAINQWTGFSTVPFVIKAGISAGQVDTVVNKAHCSVIAVLHALTLKGQAAFVSDSQSGLIYDSQPTGSLSKYLSTSFNLASGMAFDPQGNLYVAESLEHCIKKIKFE
ncbi:MAG: IPT/TIG domain-containing protein [Acidobacteriota bacterium]